MVCQSCSVLALNTTVFARVPKHSPRGDICWIPVETSARTLGKSPGNWRTVDSGRHTAVTDQATAPSTWLNQPEEGAMVQSLPHD